LGSCVSKVRRTIKGNLLLEVAKGSAESAEALKESIARVLGDAASVRAMSDETKLLVLEIRDIDSIATEHEICAAIANQYGIDAERIRVRSLRRGCDQFALLPGESRPPSWRGPDWMDHLQDPGMNRPPKMFQMLGIRAYCS